MAYYLGSDVDVFMTTEHGTYSVSGGVLMLLQHKVVVKVQI